MFPLVTPLAVQIADGDRDVILHSFATILSGAVFGDHCSPISDTTVLSSIACGCDHQDHVGTQFVYALTIGFISVVFGDFCAGAGSPVSVCWIVSILLIIAVILCFGTKIPAYTPGDAEDGGGELEDV